MESKMDVAKLKAAMDLTVEFESKLASRFSIMQEETTQSPTDDDTEDSTPAATPATADKDSSAAGGDDGEDKEELSERAERAEQLRAKYREWLKEKKKVILYFLFYFIYSCEFLMTKTTG